VDTENFSELRRAFLSAIPRSAALASVLAMTTSLDVSAQEIADPEAERFWKGDIRRPSQVYAAQRVAMAGPSHQPVFAYYDESAGRLVPQASIDPNDLPKDGTTNVSFRVIRFRPSTNTAKEYAQAESGTLRIDIKQTEPLAPLPEALAWTAIASLLKENGSTPPPLDQLTIDPGQKWGLLQKVPITNGLGFWSWNFFLKRRVTTWDRVMAFFRRVNREVVPLLGLPGIAVTALALLDEVFGRLQAESASTWLFKSVDTPVYTTQQGKSLIGSGLPLKTGIYVLVPSSALSELGKIASSVIIRDGYIVPRDAGDFDYIDAAARVMPAVDYMTVYVNVS